MAYFIQTAPNHFTKKAGIVLPAMSGKTANEAQIGSKGEHLSRKFIPVPGLTSQSP